LIFHLQCHRRSIRISLARQHGNQLAAIGFHFTEKFVDVLVACGHLQCVGGEAIARDLNAGAVPVQVIAVVDFPVHLNPVTAGRSSRQHIGLIHRQQVCRIDGAGRESSQQQGQQQRHGGTRQKSGHGSGFLGRTSVAQYNLPSLSCRAAFCSPGPLKARTAPLSVCHPRLAGFFVPVPLACCQRHQPFNPITVEAMQ
jgi:hypothetical protein